MSGSPRLPQPRSLLIVLAAFVCCETSALASATGGLDGTVVDAESSAPIAGAQVTASDSFQIETATTDAMGHFALRSLLPDTYTITANKSGFVATSVTGIVVRANTGQVVSLKMARELLTIAHVSSTTQGQHGNGVITPLRSWQEAGRDCYYGRYVFTYVNGATEGGKIVWPFCYDRGNDPFKESPRQIPFPLPVAGFELSPGTQMPPIEKGVYENWSAAKASASSPP